MTTPKIGWMEGFDTQHPLAHYLTDLTGTIQNVADGRGGGRRLEARSASRGAAHGLDLGDANAEVWAGFAGWVQSPGNSGNFGSVFHLFANGVEDRAIVEIGRLRETGSTSDLTLYVRFDESFGTAMLDTPENREVRSATGALVNSPAVSPWKLRIQRGEAVGRFTFWYEGSVLVDVDDVTQLAASAGPITGVGFSNYMGPDSPSGWNWYDDVWAADQDLGDSRIVMMAPNAAGFHNDGTPSGAGANYEQLNHVPPSDAEHVTFAAVGDKDTYGWDDSELTGVSALRCAGIMLQPRFTGPSTIKGLARIGTTDHVLGDVSNADAALATKRLIVAGNPATLDLWTAADLGATEFGIEA